LITKYHVDELKKEKYDLIIDLHKSRKSTWLCYRLDVETIKYDKLNFEKWLLVHFKINLLKPNLHLVDRYFQSLSKIGVKNDGLGLDYFIEEDRDFENELPKSYVLIVLGAAHFTKRIPVDLTERIIENYHNPVVLIGGKDVIDEGLVIEKKYGAKVKNIVGKSTINQSAIALKNAQMIYAGDTGMMHLGAALKKEINVIWGNTMPIIGMYPYYGDHDVKYISHEVELECRPCSKLGHKSCPKKHFKCMLDQKLF
jgi:ADP-heptose:LPS heptosyltransferase